MKARQSVWNWIMVPGFLVGAWLAGFLLFVVQMPSQVDDVETHTDAIVVLTGGSERITTGLLLLDHGLADRLFVSGVHKGVDTVEILKVAHADLSKNVVSRIDLGHLADDTVGNADETAQWVKANSIRSVRLVTAAYHMQRSLWEFHRVMPDTKIIPHPVFPDHGRSGQIGYALLLASEYSKYAVARIRYTLRTGEAS